MKLIIASNNRHKTEEIKAILGSRFECIMTLCEAGIEHETVEDGETFLENAEKKAREIAKISGSAAIADDSGLCVDALGGAPGIYSARFCGRHGDDEGNNALLLERLRGEENRRAHYTAAAVIAYPDGNIVSAEGYMYGKIIHAPRGNGGFGYDPLFVPDGEARTLAEMSAEEKNRISHRGAALRALLSELSAREEM